METNFSFRQAVKNFLVGIDFLFENGTVYGKKLVVSVSSVCSEYTFAAAFIYAMAVVGIYHSSAVFLAPVRWALALQGAQLKLFLVVLGLVALYFLVGRATTLTSSLLKTFSQVFSKKPDTQQAK